MDIKAAFFDMDGTLFSHTLHKIPDKTLKALKLLKEKGILIFCATGRSIQELKELNVADLGFDGFILLNGAILLDSELKLKKEFPIDPKDMENIRFDFEEKKIPILYVTDSQAGINFINDTVKKVQADISSPVPPVKNFTDEKVYQLNIYGSLQDADYLMAKMPHSLKTSWNDEAYDVLNENCSKKSGAEFFMKQYDLNPDTIIAFGDGENDIPLIEYAKYGVAMENGSLKLKETASHICPSVDESGIIEGLRHFNVINDTDLQQIL